MKAVVFGPGRIGCGVAAEALGASCELVLVSRDLEKVDHFNRVGKYKVRLVDGCPVQEREVVGVRGVSFLDADRVADEVADADVVATSVGARGLASVAPVLARGLARRATPTNVLAFENLPSAGARLEKLVAKHSRRATSMRHGFSSVLVARAVTQRLGDLAGDQPVTFVGDPPAEVLVDRAGIVQPLPRACGLRPVGDLGAWFARKLYTFSAGHATTAYLGYLKGYSYIHAAIRDREIRAAALAAMTEGRCGLLRRYGPEVAGDEGELEAIVHRFENAGLDDPVTRVARDPRRKLAPGDRLVGAARLAEAAGVVPATLALAAGAALLFADPADPAGAIRDEVEAKGLAQALASVSQVAPGDPLARGMERVWRRLGRDWRSDSPLVELGWLMPSHHAAARIRIADAA